MRDRKLGVKHPTLFYTTPVQLSILNEDDDPIKKFQTRDQALDKKIEENEAAKQQIKTAENYSAGRRMASGASGGWG